MQLPSDANYTGRNLGPEELDILKRVIDSGTLNCTKGTMVKEFENKFAQKYGVEFCRTTTSGTASIHTAVASINPEPGDEIITTPITDMGALTPIIYQTAIPIFADVDPLTYNVTAETIAPKITRRTKAIIVTHLFGNPCNMDPIMDLARQHSLPVIEDACQTYLSEYKGKLVGTIGDIGCFSLQQGKHMTTGEGGIVISNNGGYTRRMGLFINKAWGYGDPKPDHYFLAPNYRMTELQGAVALAQLDKLERVVTNRIRTAQMLSELISDIPGVGIPKVTRGGKHQYWRYPIRIDEEIIRDGVDRFAAELKERGIFSAPRYIQKPAFMCQVLREKNTFGNSHFPFEGECRKNDSPIIYDPKDFPG
ncbi:DegT/DnrJ/EryC1/StrS family aminotransferase, partial [bacterium]|nr:DegT/DnrJ/EryC1/StrS family aminotransferase [bacterium]